MFVLGPNRLGMLLVVEGLALAGGEEGTAALLQKVVFHGLLVERIEVLEVFLWDGGLCRLFSPV